MNDRQIRAFLAVTQQGSFIRAAEGLYLSKQGLMKQVDALTTEMDAYTMELSQLRKRQIDILSSDRQKGLRVQFVYLNVLQESQQLLSELRHFMRAYKNFQQ